MTRGQSSNTQTQDLCTYLGQEGSSHKTARERASGCVRLSMRTRPTRRQLLPTWVSRHTGSRPRQSTPGMDTHELTVPQVTRQPLPCPHLRASSHTHTHPHTRAQCPIYVQRRQHHPRGHCVQETLLGTQKGTGTTRKWTVYSSSSETGSAQVRSFVWQPPWGRATPLSPQPQGWSARKPFPPVGGAVP